MEWKLSIKSEILAEEIWKKESHLEVFPPLVSATRLGELQLGPSLVSNTLP